MAIVRAQVALQAASALPEDVTVNTFHFSTSDLAQATLDAITDQLNQFYTSVPAGGTVDLESFFSTEVAQNGHTIKLYDMADATPRVPIEEATFNLGLVPNGDPLPGEVALCLSFQGAKVSGQPQARRRGRVYIGRLDKDSAAGGRPTGLLRTTLALCGDQLATQSDLAATWSWIVLSPAFDGMIEDVDGTMVPHPTREAYGETFAVVTNGWVDDAFDTQRRRGLAASARTLFSI